MPPEAPEESYRLLAEQMAEGAATVTTDGLILYANGPLCTMLGAPRERILGANLREFVAAQDRAAFGAILERGDAQGDVQLLHSGGGMKPARISARRFRADSAGRLCTVISDLGLRENGALAAESLDAERRRLNAELRTASRYAPSLIEASLDPLVTISPEGKITDVNEATELATGVRRGQLIGSDFSDYFTEPGRARAGYRKVLSDGLVRDYPLTLRHIDGHTTDVLYNAVVYRSERGEVQGVFAAARDVTERNRAEAELGRYRDHLEEIVRKRTGELETANADLQRTTAELLRSNEDLSQFAFVISHDLRSPLNAITAFARQLKEDYQDKLGAEADEYLSYMTGAAERMLRLIADLLAYSRVARGEGSESAPTSLSQALKAAELNLEGKIRETGAVITHDPLPDIVGSPSQVAQLFQNLLENALKFRSAAPPHIHVSVERRAQEWVFCVADNGIGIDPQHLDQIFLIFKRLHGDAYEGTGIGLAICKKIVERHGGRLWAESEPGKRTKFYFTLPTESSVQGAAQRKPMGSSS